MPHASSKKSLLFVQFWAAHGFCKRVLNSRIWQHCDVKTSMVTPTFYYFFIITLTCYISVPSFIYNVCQVILLKNHLKFCLYLIFGQMLIMSTRYPHLHPCQNFDFLDFAKGNQTPNTKCGQPLQPSKLSSKQGQKLDG